MINPKALEAWFTLVTEAMRGTEEAQEALKSLSKMSANSEELSHWLTRFMPGLSPAAVPQPQVFENWLEEWWRAMGVVPRTRYLDLLERCDRLQRRLEKAEETIQKLQTLLDSKGQPEDEARQVLDAWSRMLEETLKTQTEWMRAWTAANEQKSVGPDDPGSAADDDLA